MDRLLEAVESEPVKRDRMMDMDYVTYAEGEAELGWLNCQIKASAESRFDLDQLVLRIVDDISQELESSGSEIAHLKVLGQTLNDSAVANRVGSVTESELSLASEIKTQSADLLVNARVASSPELLESIVSQVASGLASELNIDLAVGQMQSFRPGKPEPTHRAS